MVGRSAKVGSPEQVPRSWKAGPEIGRMGGGASSGTGYPKDELCSIGLLVFTVCVVEGTTLATSTLGKQQAWVGAKIA